MVKLTLVLGVAALKSTTATFQQMISQYKNTTGVQYKAPRGPEARGQDARQVGPQGRNIMNSNALAMLDAYGCWCYFGSDRSVGLGRGAPVDPVDEACKLLHQAYDCIVMDIEAEGGWHDHKLVRASDASLTDAQRLAAGFKTECEPWVQMYIPAYYTDEINALGMYDACEAMNEPNVYQGMEGTPIRGITTTSNSFDSHGLGRCATLACAVEALFVESIVLLQTSGTYVSDLDQYSQARGFDAAVECAVIPLPGSEDEPFTGSQGANPGGSLVLGFVASEPECCGVYPVRYQYHPETKSGPRGCCGQDVFDSSLNQCCDAATSEVDTTC